MKPRLFMGLVLLATGGDLFLVESAKISSSVGSVGANESAKLESGILEQQQIFDEFARQVQQLSKTLHSVLKTFCPLGGVECQWTPAEPGENQDLLEYILRYSPGHEADVEQLSLNFSNGTNNASAEVQPGEIQQNWTLVADIYELQTFQDGDFLLQASGHSEKSIPKLLDTVQLAITEDLLKVSGEVLQALKNCSTATLVNTTELTTSLNELNDETGFQSVLDAYEMLREIVGISGWTGKEKLRKFYKYFEHIASKAESEESRVATLKKSVVKELKNLVDKGKSTTSGGLRTAIKDVLNNITRIGDQELPTNMSFQETLTHLKLLKDTEKLLEEALALKNQPPEETSNIVRNMSEAWNSASIVSQIPDALKRYQILEAARSSTSVNPFNGLQATLTRDLRHFRDRFSNVLSKAYENFIDQATMELDNGRNVKGIIDNLKQRSDDDSRNVLREVLRKLSKFTSKTLYTELVVHLPSSAEDFIVIENFYERVINNASVQTTEIQGLEFDAALQIAYPNADKQLKKLLKPLIASVGPNRTVYTKNLAERILSGSLTNAQIPETFQYHGAGIVAEAYDKKVNNADKILKFVENPQFLLKPEDRLLAYKTLFEKMSDSGHLGSEQFLHFVFKLKKFQADFNNLTSWATKDGLDALISKIPRNVRELVFYGDRADKRCVIKNKVHGLKLNGRQKYLFFEDNSSDWRFETSDGGKRFYISTGSGRAKNLMYLGLYSSAHQGVCSTGPAGGYSRSAREKTTTAKTHTVDIKDYADKAARDQWKIVPVEDARYLHFETLHPSLPGGLLYAERFNSRADQVGNQLKCLASVPARSNAVATEALMEIHCADA